MCSLNAWAQQNLTDGSGTTLSFIKDFEEPLKLKVANQFEDPMVTIRLPLSKALLVSQLLYELESRREKGKIDKEIFNIIPRLKTNYVDLRTDHFELQDNVNKIIDALEQPWYDHFWVGAGVTGMILTALFVLASR